MPSRIFKFPSLTVFISFTSTILYISTVNSHFISGEKENFKNMKKISNDSVGGRGVTFVPNSGEYKNVILWFHGLGDSADGWASMMPSLEISDTKFILPTAPSRSISLNLG